MLYRKRPKTGLLVLHDSHSRPDIERPCELLRWQGRKRGLLDIGYHIIIDRIGNLHLVRPLDTMGSHAAGYNHLSIGMCLVGGLGEDGEPENNFTHAQKVAATVIGACFLTEHPKAKVLGHKELKGYRDNSECPALDMNTLRHRIQRGLETLTDGQLRPLSQVLVRTRRAKEPNHHAIPQGPHAAGPASP